MNKYVVIFLFTLTIPLYCGWIDGLKTAHVECSVNEYISAYKSKSTLQDAVSLQAMNRESAVRELRDMAQPEHGNKSCEVYVLCRMLFVQSNSLAFREPLLGGPDFIRGSSSDWPLAPVALVDGVPFIVVKGYTLGGLAESPEQYLDYCLSNCCWSNFRYEREPQEKLQTALDSLLNAAPWSQPLTDWDRRFLSMQIDE